jgi:Amt family ammonium transporter
MMGSVWLLDWKLKVDDPLGAVSVHASCGIWGMISLGIFADGSYGGVAGVITGSGWQLLAQFIAVVACMAWCFAAGAFLWYIMKYTMGIRVREEQELMGLDKAVHGIDCYAPDVRLVDLEKLVRGGKK